MKALRIVLAILTGAIVLLIIVAVIAVQSFDLNDYKDEITASVQERTGRILTIDDSIEFSLFPWFAVETGGVSLTDDPDFGDRSFVTIDSLSARVRVWPLLKRRIEVGRIILDGVNLNFSMDDEGQGNWSSLLQMDAPQEPALEAPEPEGPLFDTLAVEGIELRNARILWHDPEGEVIYIVRDLTLITGPINDDDPVDVSVALSLLDVASQASAEIDLQTVATTRPATEFSEIEARVRVLDPREQERATTTVELSSISLDDGLIRSGPAELSARLLSPPVGADELDIEAEFASIELDTESEGLVINGLVARSGGIDANFNLRGDSVLSEPRLSGSLNIRAEQVAALFDVLGIAPPSDLAAEDIGGFAANADFNLVPGTRALSVNQFVATALGMEATGQAELAGDGSVRAEINLPAFRPQQPLLDLMAPRLPAGVDLGAISSASLAASLTLGSDGETLEVGALAMDLDGALINGRLMMDDFQAPEQIEGRFTATGLDNRLLGALFGPWLPDDLEAANLGEFRLASDFEYTTGSRIAVFAPLEITAYGLSGDGQLTIVNADDALTLSGRAMLAEFSPLDLLQRFDLPVPQTADPTVLRSAELAASFETDGANGEFRDIAVELDDSRITGEFSVENFADPAYRFVLRADRLNADRYLPPRDTGNGSDTGESNERLLGDIRLTAEPLTATVVSGTASVGNLRIGGMDFDQLGTDLTLGSGRAALSSVRTELYGGEFAGGLTIDATGETSEVHLTGNLTEVALEPLLSAMLGSTFLSGTGNIGLDLTGRGNTINETLQSASGNLNVALQDGTIDGINLGFELCELVNDARGLPPPATSPGVTEYSLIRSNATVSDGIASSPEIYATTGYLDLTGRGNMRLVDQWIDNQYRVAMTGPVPIAGCEDLNETIADDPVPFNFTLRGRFPDIDRGYDVNQLVEDLLRRELDQQVDDRIEEARDDIIDNALRRLFD